MAAIYKSGAKWVVKTSTANYNLDSGDVILTETVDGNYFQLKLDSETILNSSYLLVTNEAGTLYTKPELVSILDQLVVKSDANLYPSGKPVLLTAEFNRPADVLDYAANDRIGPVTVAVKQKETMTLSGAVAVKQKQTLTLSGGTPVKQKQTITLTGSEAQKQKETITLTGTGGTARITVAGGLSKIVTFAVAGTTDLTQTAADFVTSWADDYLATDIVVTSDAATIIFEALNWGVGFDAPLIANVTTNLAGTVAHTTANLTHNGMASIDISYVGFNLEQKGTLANTASEFVTANATSFLGAGVVLTSSGADLILEAETAGTPFEWWTITNTAGDLSGTSVQTTQNTPFGVAAIGLPHVLTKVATYATSLSATALAFKNANAAAFLAVGITLTNSSADLIFEAAVAGTAFEVVTISTAEGTLTGTVVATTANRAIGTATIDGLTATFTTDATTSAANFVTAHVAAYLTAGIVLTSSGADLIFEASAVGIPFTAPVFVNLTGTFAQTTVHTLANATINALEFSGDAGESGYISFIKIDAPAKFASQDLTLILYKSQPTGLVGDNVAFVYDAANSLVRVGEIPVTMNAVINSSAIVRGQAFPFLTYVSGTAKKLYGILTTGAAVVAPNTAGKFTIIATTVQLS